MKKQAIVKKRITPIFRNAPETLRYFYHPDHIGSTSWVTDSARNGIQYCEYLPYKKLRFFSSLAFGKTNEFVLHSLPASVGEPFLEKRSTTWNSRYTFSGKERDNETGYSYFGARYYNSDISIWLSVDPLSDKYPNLTPYAYCANNPIILVDPDGRKIRMIGTESNTLFRLYLQSFKGVTSDNMKQAFSLNDLNNADNEYAFKENISFKEFKTNFRNITGERLKHKDAKSLYNAISNKDYIEFSILSFPEESYTVSVGSPGTTFVPSIPNYESSKNYNKELLTLYNIFQTGSSKQFNQAFEESISDASGDGWKYFSFESSPSERNRNIFNSTLGTVLINGYNRNNEQKLEIILQVLYHAFQE